MDVVDVGDVELDPRRVDLKGGGGFVPHAGFPFFVPYVHYVH